MIRLKQLREQRGFSQKEFAAEMDLPYTTYNSYETGKRAPDFDMLSRFADYFHVSIDFLLGHDTPSSALPSPTYQITPHEQALIEAYRKHPEMWAGIRAMLGLLEPLDDEANARTVSAVVEALRAEEKESVPTR